MRSEKSNFSQVFGLTGGMGSGKSTVLGMFKKKGAFTVDSDAIVHLLLKNDQNVLKAIRKKFGDTIFSGKNKLDKKALAAIAFSSLAMRQTLEKILHPVVQKRILKALRQKHGFVATVDVPLLYESGWEKLFDDVIVVNAGMAHRLKRLKAKGFDVADAKRRIKAQWPLQKKVRLADFVIKNNGPKTQTQKQVDHIWTQLTGRN